MSLPFRPRAPVWGPAPTAGGRSLGGLGSRGLTLGARAGSGAVAARYGRFVLRGGPAWLLLYAWLMQQAWGHLSAFMYAIMYGLTFSRFCPIPIAPSFVSIYPTDSCLTSQAALQYTMADIPRLVANATNGSYLLMYYQYLSPLGFLRYSTVSTWRVTRSVAGAERPYYTRVGPPIAVPVSSRVAVASPPRHVPWFVAPRPAWRQTDASIGKLPEGDHAGNGRSRYAPPIRDWGWDISTPRASPEALSRSDVRAVPTDVKREAKVGANTLAARLVFLALRAREASSEVVDALDAIWKGFPREVRMKCRSGDKACKARVLVEDWKHLDAGLAIRALVANHIEDAIIGGTYFKARAALRNAVYGDTVGSLGNQSGLLKAYGGAISDIVDQVMDELWPIPVEGD